MASDHLGKPQSLERPYTVGTFQTRLKEFSELIEEMTMKDVEASAEEKRIMISENLRYDQFCDSIKSLFGPDIHNNDLKSIYRKITSNPEANVDWSELFGYFQSEEEGGQQEVPIGEDVNVFSNSARRRFGDASGDKRRRDVVISMKHIPSIDCYVTASQKGAISLWTNKLTLQACTEIDEAAWVTGVDYLPVLRRIVICTERSINIWDTRAKANQGVFSIKPISPCPQCLVTVSPSNQTTPNDNNKKQNQNGIGQTDDLVLYGDDQGNVCAVKLTAKDLTAKSSKTDRNYTQSRSLDPNKLTHPIKKRKLHNDWVIKIKFFPELRCFASCSASNVTSFYLEEVDRIFDDLPVREVAISKGINAFDYCIKANIIATGGVDKVIRVWHPHIFSRPTGKLIGHLFTIVDMVMNERDQHIISLSTARVFRIWDIHTLTCLQVFTDNEDRPGERRIYTISYDNKHERMISGSSVLDTWPLTRSIRDAMQVPLSHDRPINMMIFNKALKQVISVCAESLLKMWEMESGKLVCTITDGQGIGVEITCLGLEDGEYRLATGGADGSLKIWDCGSGQELKHLELRTVSTPVASIATLISSDSYLPPGYAISNIRYCDAFYDGRKYLMVQDVEGVIYLIHDTEGNDLLLMKTFTEEELSSSISNVEQIDYVSHRATCLDCLEHSVMVTGSSNGDILMWDTSMQCLDSCFAYPGQTKEDKVDEADSTADCLNAVESLKFLIHKSVKKEKGKREKSRCRSRAATYSKVKSAKSGKSERSSILATVTVEKKEQEVKQDDVDLAVTPSGRGEDTGSKIVSGVAASSKHDVEGLQHQLSDTHQVPVDPTDLVTYEPILVAGYRDCCLRFWNIRGDFLKEVTPVTRRPGGFVTCMASDEHCNTLFTGDHCGYICILKIGRFLENFDTELDEDNISQVISWRGHMHRIVTIEHVQASSMILTASVDGSIRIWNEKKHTFIGFFGQFIMFNSISSTTSESPAMPFDINEMPLLTTNRNQQKNEKNTTQLEYPLVFANDKWKEFRRSAYEAQIESPDNNPVNKKFFSSLMKPRSNKDNLDSFVTGEMKQGAVFRALPIYRVKTPARPKSPAIVHTSSDIFKSFSTIKPKNKLAKRVRNVTDITLETNAKN